MPREVVDAALALGKVVRSRSTRWRRNTPIGYFAIPGLIEEEEPTGKDFGYAGNSINGLEGICWRIIISSGHGRRHINRHRDPVFSTDLSIFLSSC